MSQIPDKVSESFKRLNPEIYATNTPKSPIPNAKPKRNKTPALGSAVQRKTSSIPSVRLCFTGYRVRPLDPDNFAGSVKDLLDGLRHAQLIYGDEWWRISLETKQVKVAHYEEEYTLIEIETE